MLFALLCRSFASVPIVLPPNEDGAVWRDALKLAGLTPATSAALTVRVVGVNWVILARGADGTERELRLPIPTTPGQRDEFAVVARGLARDLALADAPGTPSSWTPPTPSPPPPPLPPMSDPEPIPEVVATPRKSEQPVVVRKPEPEPEPEPEERVLDPRFRSEVVPISVSNATPVTLPIRLRRLPRLRRFVPFPTVHLGVSANAANGWPATGGLVAGMRILDHIVSADLEGQADFRQFHPTYRVGGGSEGIFFNTSMYTITLRSRVGVRMGWFRPVVTTAVDVRTFELWGDVAAHVWMPNVGAGLEFDPWRGHVHPIVLRFQVEHDLGTIGISQEGSLAATDRMPPLQFQFDGLIRLHNKKRARRRDPKREVATW